MNCIKCKIFHRRIKVTKLVLRISNNRRITARESRFSSINNRKTQCKTALDGKITLKQSQKVVGWERLKAVQRGFLWRRPVHHRLIAKYFFTSNIFLDKRTYQPTLQWPPWLVSLSKYFRLYTIKKNSNIKQIDTILMKTVKNHPENLNLPTLGRA